MSFSSQVKNELCRIEATDYNSMIAELVGIIAFAGILKRSSAGSYLRLNTENASVARRIFNFLKYGIKIHIEIKIRKNRTIKYMNTYSIYVTNKNDLNKLLREIKFIDKSENCEDLVSFRINKGLISSTVGKKALIRGAFLGGGSITDPEKNYHFEFVTHHYFLIKDLCEVLEVFELNPKTIKRKSNNVIYFKGSQYISDLLNLMGAHKSLLELENIRIVKDVKNNVNRLVNCETANLGKTVNASIKQIQNINLIKNTIGLDKLPKNLQDIARLRLEYREASLKELGQMLSPCVGKSGVNHRLRKLEKIAHSIDGHKTYNE